MGPESLLAGKQDLPTGEGTTRGPIVYFPARMCTRAIVTMQ